MAQLPKGQLVRGYDKARLMGVAGLDPFQVVIRVQQYFTKGRHDVETNQLQQKLEHFIYQPFFNNYSTLQVSQRCKYHMYIHVQYSIYLHDIYECISYTLQFLYKSYYLDVYVIMNVHARNIPTDAEYITDCYFVCNQNA